MEINQDKLLNEMKKRIAISNFDSELENAKINPNIFPNQIKDWRKYIMNKKKALNIASIFLVAVVIFGVSTSIYAKRQWNIRFEEYKNREYEVGIATLKDAEESGYVENIKMDYIFQDNIGVKLDSLLITDEYLESKVNFKFPDNLQLNTETFTYGFAIYDENNNIYSINFRPHWGDMKKHESYPENLCAELGIDFPATYLADTAGTTNIEATEQSMLTKINITSSTGFPKSKKLYVRVFDLGYHMFDYTDDSTIENEMENFNISDSEWIFEIDIPEKFYERTTTELTLKDNIENLSIEKIAVSEVGLIVRGTLNGFEDMLKATKIPAEEIDLRKSTIYITDEAGNIYYENTAGLVANKDWFRMNFEITKNMLNQKFFLNVKVGEQVSTSELIIK